MLTDDMKRIVHEQRLGLVATVDPDGVPAVSPKATFVVLDDRTLAFGDIRSPQTMRNLAANPALEVVFVDPFVRKGYRFAGRASVHTRGSTEFARLGAVLAEYGSLVGRMRAIVTIAVTRALPLRSPAYDDGAAEADIRRQWVGRFRAMQPEGRFED